MAIQIKRTGSEDYGQTTKVLICGDPGAGKTLISSTWPNVLYASAEGGLMSVADRNIPYVEIKKSEDLLRLKNMLEQPADVREEMLGFPVETVVIDTIDEIQKILMRERMESQKRDAMQMQDWGWLNEQMQAIVRGFRNLDMHVVFTCHLKETVDSESGRVTYRPAMAGAIGDSIPSYVDLALRLGVSRVNKMVDDVLTPVQVRTLFSTPDQNHTWIKDRSGKLPAELDVDFETDYERIAEAIFGNVNIQETESFSVADEDLTPVVPSAPISTTPPTPPEKKVAKKTPAKTASGPSVLPSETPKAPKVTPGTPEAESAGPVKPRNQLPDGVKANPKGHGTALFCVECGDEVESEDRADLSRIRFRKILDNKCFEAQKKS